MSTAFIELDQISKQFGTKEIVKNLSLKIEKGQRLALIGQSGCGKSTILRLLLGLHSPDKGTVRHFGKNIAEFSQDEMREYRLKFGMLFQSAALFDSMTVAENIAFSLIENLKWGPAQVSRRVEELLEQVGLKGLAEAMPATLSGGQKKRVGLARAIAHYPEIILYDEPTTGLDPVLSTSIENLIVDLGSQLEVTSVIVSHQESTVLRTSDQIYMMHEKALLEAETPDRIKQSSNPVIRHFINGGIDH